MMTRAPGRDLSVLSLTVTLALTLTMWGGCNCTGTPAAGDDVDAGATPDPAPNENAPPVPRIDAPVDGDVIQLGDGMTLSGSADDPEDGPLAGSALSWSSDRDGLLWTGDSYRAHLQASGTHVITLTATDSEGLQASSSVTVTVVDGIPVSVRVAPDPAQVAVGLSTPLSATAVFADASTADVTALATWDIDAPAIASVGDTAADKGVLTGLSAGTATVSATFAGVTGSAAVDVAAVVSVAVSPPAASLAVGFTTPLSAVATLSDGSTRDVTGQALWSSSDTATATVSNAAGSQGVVTALAPGAASIRAELGGVAGFSTVTVAASQLTAITVSPSSASLSTGLTLAFTATGTFSDGSTQLLTSQVAWSSSNAAVAAVSNSAGSEGVATGVAPGTATIVATSGGISGSATLDVSNTVLTSIAVAPGAASIPDGFTQAFSAVGTFSDGSTQNLTAQVLWSSSSAAVATISNAVGSQGLATGANAGTATISASLNGVSGGASLTVTAAVLTSISVAPASALVTVGQSRAFLATGVFSDGTSFDVTAQVAWSSTDAAVATVSNSAGSQGLATGVAPGIAAIVATSGGVSGSATLDVAGSVLTSIAVAPATTSLPVGFTQAFSALGTFSDGSTQNLTAQVLWSSSNGAVATISNAAGSQGVASGANVGTANITAAISGVSGSASLTVTAAVLTSISVAPASALVTVGQTRAFVATGVFSDGTSRDVTTQAAWSSTNAATATVSNAAGSQGVATGVAAGSVTIVATASGISGSATLSVSNAVLTSIAVAPAAASVPVGFTRAFSAVGTFSDGSTQDLTAQVLWSSSNGAVATLSNAAGSQGVATGASVGTANITAALSGVSGSASLTVTAATLTSIAVVPATASIAAGLTQAFTATGTFSDGSTLNLTTQATWSSSNGAVATVSNAPGSQGLANGVSVGTATINAALSGVAGSASLTVTAAVLTSIAVAPATASVAAGLTQTFTATGTFSDGSTQNITTQVAWSSSNGAVATVSNTAGSQGVASGVSPGSATIGAALNGVSGSAGLTVTAAVLVSITVAPASATVAIGATQAFTAQGAFSDGSSADVTATVSWSTSDGSVATVSNAGGSRGVATGVGVGSATVVATSGGVTGNAAITVVAVTLTSIAVAPANATLPQGAAQRYTATGTFSDGSTANVTAQATWSSTSTAVATISNGAGLEGVATTVAAGSTTIRATLNGVIGSTTLTVSGVTLTSITIAPANPTLGAGDSVAFTATGQYSDGSTRNLTAFADWLSTDSAVITVSDAPGSKGNANAVDVGQADVTASFGGRVGTSSVTVN